MFKRRSHARFVVANSDSVLRVPYDVTLTAINGQMVATSVEPLANSDAMMLEMMIDGHIALVPVRVAETSPIIVEGEIRHRLRLSYLDPND